MKPYLIGPVLLVLLNLMSAPAQAGEHCSLNLTPGVLDFGVSNRAALLAQAHGTAAAGSFGVRLVFLRIHCTQSTPMSWRFVAPAADAQRFRFGSGTLLLRVKNVRLDGATVRWRSEAGEGVGEANILRPGERALAGADGAAAQGHQLEVELEVEASVPDSVSRARDLTRLEGGGRFQMN